jgi:GTP-binding protein HflX
VKENSGIDALLAEMQYQLQQKRTKLKLRIPQAEYHMVTEAIRYGKVVSQEYEENDVLVEVELPTLVAYRFLAYVEK